MASRPHAVVSGHAARARRAKRSRSGLTSSSEQQIQAYLVARDLLRRILRTNTLVMPPPNAGGRWLRSDPGQ